MKSGPLQTTLKVVATASTGAALLHAWQTLSKTPVQPDLSSWRADPTDPVRRNDRPWKSKGIL